MLSHGMIRFQWPERRASSSASMMISRSTAESSCGRRVTASRNVTASRERDPARTTALLLTPWPLICLQLWTRPPRRAAPIQPHPDRCAPPILSPSHPPTPSTLGGAAASVGARARAPAAVSTGARTRCGA
eukprot:6394703-Prymnesium_polylepis.1